MYTGYLFSRLVGNGILLPEIKSLSAAIAPALTSDKLKQLDEILRTAIPTDRTSCGDLIASIQQQFSLTRENAAVILLAIATAHSPAQNNNAVVETVIEYLEPAAIVETVVWLGVLQLLNRLSSYYSLIGAY